MVTQHEQRPEREWVLLSYRIPREPSTPRIAVWRKLKDLGVAKIGDGLVALPADVRTQEHLEWIAETVREADGEAIVWTASPTPRRIGRELALEMSAERNAEYSALLDEVNAESPPGSRAIQRWRREWRRISRRDYFLAEQRDRARLAISAAAEAVGMTNERQS